MKSLAMLLGLLAPLAMEAETNRVPELPVEYFFRNSEFGGMRISRDGKFLAGVAYDKSGSFLFGIDLETGKKKSIASGDITSFSWLNNERLLVEIGGIGLGGLMAINRDSSKLKLLQKPFLYQIRDRGFHFQYVRILGEPAESSDTVLLEKGEISPFGKMELPHPDIMRLNFFTGESTLEEKNPGNVIGWVADNRGVVRVGYAVEKEVEKILYRRDRQEPWTVIHESRVGHEGIRPAGFSAKGDELLVEARGGKDTLGFYPFDPVAQKLGRCLWQNANYDAWSQVTAGRAGKLLGVHYQADRPQVEWLVDDLRMMQEAVDSSLPETFNWLLNSSRDRSRILFNCFSDRSPGTYYLFDTNRNELSLICKEASWIDPAQMAPMKSISYEARDGLTLHGYLTIPVGSSGKNLALIVMPHGGPWARDTWRFDPEVQFLANRGYAVLQMNFRGSTGYGLAFEKAGYREWGRKMQDDITDGVEWAIKEGIADRNHIGIFGASYGGYAALMGMISTPELFKCGICYVGVTDIISHLKNKPFRMPKIFDSMEQELIGYYDIEKEDLNAVSPMQHVDKIRAPLFLAYGGRDPIVNIEQGRGLAKALDKGKKKYEMVIEENEGHGFSNETNRIKLFKRIDKFLKANL